MNFDIALITAPIHAGFLASGIWERFSRASFYIAARAISLAVSLSTTLMLLKNKTVKAADIGESHVYRYVVIGYTIYFLVTTSCDIAVIVNIVNFNIGFVVKPLLGILLFVFFDRALKEAGIVTRTAKSLMLFLIGYAAYLVTQTILIFIGVYFIVGQSPISLR